MRPLPKRIEYRLVEKEVEVKEGGVHKGWETIREIHRIVVKNDGGRQLTTSDTVVSTDPQKWKEANPKEVLIGAHHGIGIHDIQTFIDTASPEELAELGITVATEDDGDDDEVDSPFPVHRGGPHWTLSNGDSFIGSREAAERAERDLHEE